MHTVKWGPLATVALVAWLGAGCCPELREVVQKERLEVTPDLSLGFEAPDCFDTGKQALFAVLWKSGLQETTLEIDGLQIAKFPAQTCDLVAQAAEALGDAIGGALDDAIGDIGCAFHIMQGPDFERDDVVTIQDLKQAGFEWQVFKLPTQAVQPGSNNINFVDVKDSTEQCTGEDRRGTTELAFLLVSDVDDPCDDKFKD